MADNDSGMAFVSGFLLGGLVGAAIGLLLAPKSGAETRAGIAEHSDEWRHRAEDIAGQISSQHHSRHRQPASPGGAGGRRRPREDGHGGSGAPGRAGDGERRARERTGHGKHRHRRGSGRSGSRRQGVLASSE